MAHVILRDITKRFGQRGRRGPAEHRDRARANASPCSGPPAAARPRPCACWPASRTWTRVRSWSATASSPRSLKNYYLPPEKRDFGMVFQAFAVWPHLSVFDNVAFPAPDPGAVAVGDPEKTTHGAGVHRPARLSRDSYPNELSGGQKQRIALARSISFNPTVMLLDEPLSNLDPKMREEMRFEIKELQQRFNFTIIYVTHDQAEAMALSDRIVVMDLGRRDPAGRHPGPRVPAAGQQVRLRLHRPVELPGHRGGERPGVPCRGARRWGR